MGITEDQLEQLCLTWFQAIGYDTVCGYDLAPDGDTPERSDYRQIARPVTPVLIKNNRAFHRLLLEGVKVDYKEEGEEKSDHVQLIPRRGVGSRYD